MARISSVESDMLIILSVSCYQYWSNSTGTRYLN